MFSKYYKFHILSIISAIALLFGSVIFNMYATETGAQAMNIVIKAFAGVIFFESMMIYWKILRTLLQVTGITRNQVIAGIVSYIGVFCSLCFLGISSAAYYILIASVLVRLFFQANRMDSQLKMLCRELDEEIAAFNESDSEEVQEGQDCECGCGGEHHDCDCGCEDKTEK